MKRFPERTFFYESWTVSKNNIALLMLQKPFLINKRVHPIQLMTEEVPNGADVIIAGNGHKFCFLGHWFKGDLKYNWLKFHDQKKCAEVSQLYDFNGTFCLAPTKYNEGPWKVIVKYIREDSLRKTYKKHFSERPRSRSSVQK